MSARYEPRAGFYTRPPMRNDSGVRRRFGHFELKDPAEINHIKPDNPALVQGHTIYPKTVVEADAGHRLLIGGINQSKLGDRVVKGPWSGMPTYHLTLEERATCPRSCHLWHACYGNAMHRARRNRHGPELVIALDGELELLQRRHPRGFVIRLHTLGDFYGPAYVKCWANWLDKYPALHAFGYTAWPAHTMMGMLIGKLARERWDRFAIRRSVPRPTLAEPEATTIWRLPDGPRQPEGLVCPAQTGKTACCGTCGLCWSPAMKDTPIVFVAHGPMRGRRKGAK